MKKTLLILVLALGALTMFTTGCSVDVDLGDATRRTENDVYPAACDHPWLRKCSVAFRIVVPRSLDAKMRTDTGDVGIDVLDDPASTRARVHKVSDTL